MFILCNARRNILHVTGEYYHVFNRGLDRRPVFLSQMYYERFRQCLEFYRYQNLPLKLSKYLLLTHEKKLEFKVLLQSKKQSVSLVSYALMPNHFHLLLKQHVENGISTYLSQIQNSYTRYFNVRKKRTGILFTTQNKSVHIETEDQLLHVSRYIHLNPYTGYVLKESNELLNYAWTSLPEYVKTLDGICDTYLIQNLVKDYKEFVLDQAEYQRCLHEIKHIIYD